MRADLRVGLLNEAEAGQLVYGVEDGVGVAGGQPVGAGAVVRVVGEVVSTGRAAPWGGWCREAASVSSRWQA